MKSLIVLIVFTGGMLFAGANHFFAQPLPGANGAMFVYLAGVATLSGALWLGPVRRRISHAEVAFRENGRR